MIQENDEEEDRETNCRTTEFECHNTMVIVPLGDRALTPTAEVKDNIVRSQNL